MQSILQCFMMMYSTHWKPHRLRHSWNEWLSCFTNSHQ